MARCRWLRDKARYGAPHEAIVRTAETNRCDIIVMASHGRSGTSAVLDQRDAEDAEDADSHQTSRSRRPLMGINAAAASEQ
jgi:hypothetical protein